MASSFPVRCRTSPPPPDSRRRGLEHGRDYHAVIKVSSSLLSLVDPGLDQIFEDIRQAGRLLGETILDAVGAEKGAMPEGVIYAPEIRFR